MKRVYVAGAYSANNVIDVLQNIGRGEYYAAQLFKAGFAPFTPWHDKEFAIVLWDHSFTVKQFYDYSIAWLEVSDAMFLVPGWEKSAGTIAEIKIAEKMGIPIFKTIDEMVEMSDD